MSPMHPLTATAVVADHRRTLESEACRARAAGAAPRRARTWSWRMPRFGATRVPAHTATCG